MKGLFKKTAAAAMALTMVCAAGAVSASAAEQISETHFENDSIVINVFRHHNMDLFSILTAKQENLLYEGDLRIGYDFISNTGSSRCFAEVDGVCNQLDAESYSVDEAAKSMSGVSHVNGVELTRTLAVSANSTTGKDDVVTISLTAANTDTVAHDVGVRIMLDTMLGSNDDAPFRVSGYGAVTNNTQFEGNEIPSSYNAFDSLENFTVVGAGTFPLGSGKPDIVQFNNYDASKGLNLVPSVDTEAAIGDSVVNSIWNTRTLQPGESITCYTGYGLSELDISSDSELLLAAQKNTGAFTLNDEGTGYNTVSLESYLKNAGKVELNNATVSLKLPEGVSVAEGDSSINYGKMPVGDNELQKTWVLKAEPCGNDRTVTVVVNASSDETGAITPVKLTFTIPAIEGAPVVVDPTEPEETTAPTEPTNPSDAQSSTTPDKKSTKSEATPSNASSSSSSSNAAVQTGGTTPAVLILTALISAIGLAYFYRRRHSGR